MLYNIAKVIRAIFSLGLFQGGQEREMDTSYCIIEIYDDIVEDFA